MTAGPEAISKCTGRPDVALALSATGTPATARNGPSKTIVCRRLPTVTRARSLVAEPSALVATTP